MNICFKVRICFPGEDCPGECDHGDAHLHWSKKLEYEPLTLSARSGPFFFTDSPSLDFSSVEQTEALLPSEDSEGSNRAVPEILPGCIL